LKVSPDDLRDVLQGIKDGLVFFPLYLPLALPFAVMAKLIGISSFEAVLWSALLFAGSSQLACISAIMTGANFAELMLITFLANVRHGFVSLSVLPYIRGIGKKVLPVFCFNISTTSAGAIPAKARAGGSVKIYGLALQFCQWGQWVLFSLLGTWLGPMVPPSWKRVIHFSIPAAFMGLLAPMVRANPQAGIVVVVTAAFLGLELPFFLPPHISAIIATLVAAGAGLFVKEKKNA
jgi:predicted branched-subunit amino acid permease